MKKTIYLIGFMGTGKTTVSGWIRTLTGMKEIDTDFSIVKEEKRSIPEIFEAEGEEYFRKKETMLLEQIEELSPCIVSCGGGIILKEENRAIMKRSGTVVWLTAEPETVFERVKHDRNRPLLQGNMNVSYISELMEKRMDYYKAAMDIAVQTDGKNAKSIAEEIIARLNI